LSGQFSTQSKNKTFTYKYDASGNILLKREYAYTTGSLDQQTIVHTTSYGYDSNWKDKLTTETLDGVLQNTITYDASGNQTAYNGWSYSWQGGHQLKNMSQTGTSIDYKYNSDGIRISKTVNNVETDYTVIGSKITRQSTNGNNIYYFYDSNDNLVSLNYAGTNYLYVKNLQGDIIAITDVDGNVVVEYTYDAWGKSFAPTGSMASTLGAANPYRYRGYFYDVETGLYYLQSRYYNPEMGRFINADAVDYINGSSLFAYCRNNPVNFIDPTGQTDRKFDITTLISKFGASYIYNPISAIRVHGEISGYCPAWYAVTLGKLLKGFAVGSYTIPSFFGGLGASLTIISDFNFIKNGALSIVTDFALGTAVSVAVGKISSKFFNKEVCSAINVGCGLAAALILNVALPEGEYSIQNYSIAYKASNGLTKYLDVYVVYIETFDKYLGKKIIFHGKTTTNIYVFSSFNIMLRN